MPRKKKVETVETVETIETKNEVQEVIKNVDFKKVDYGTGWCRVNNMLQAGFSIEEIRGDKNE